MKTNELRMMKYHEAINGLDSELWKAKVRKEHQRMVDSDVFEKFKWSELPSEVKIIDTTWAMKKNSSGLLRGRVNVQGFKQVEGQHYDGSSISAPVTNGMTTKIALTLMLASGGIAHVVGVKGAFLNGKLEDGEKIYIKVPLWFKEFYNDDTGLLLKNCLYGLKQAAIAIYRKLLVAASNIDSRKAQLIPASITNGKGVDWSSWCHGSMTTWLSAQQTWSWSSRMI
jgi:hypothetical protein